VKPIATLLGASASILFAAPFALAQEAGGVDEIIVTAQKTAESLQDVPISITAVSAETMERSAVATLDDIQRLAPGMTMSAIGSGFVSYTYVRGAGTNVLDSGADPSVAFFLDEVYLAGTAGLQFDLLDIERVEVLKGPQGTLFGRNAAAGAINIITRRPDEAFGAYASVDVGDYNAFNLRGGVTGPLTSDASWRYRLSAGHRERDAFTENPAGRDPGDIDNYTARGQVQYVGDTFMALFTGDYFTADNGMTNHFLSTAVTAGLLTPGAAAALPTDQSTYRHYYNVDGYEQQETSTATARLEWELPFATLTSISAYRDNSFDRLQDQDGSLADGYSLASDQHDETFSQELRLAGSSGAFEWIAGLYYYSGETQRIDTIDVGPDFAVPSFQNTLGTYNQDLKVQSYAAFGQATYNFTDQLSLTVGARYTVDEKESDQIVNPIGPAPLFTVSLNPDWSSVDPSVTLSYDASDDVMLYASARQGFKSGGFQSLPGSAVLAGSVYDPEQVRSYEAGIRSRWADGSVQVNASIFHVDIEDQQILRIPSAGLQVIDNAGRTETDGIDLSVSAFVTPAFRLDWNATLQSARFTEYFTNCAGMPLVCATDLSGNHQLRSPDFQSSLIGEYTFGLGAAGDLRLRGEYIYQDDQFFDPANTRAAGAYQPAYDLFNARVTYVPAAGNWDLSVFGKNLSDEEYLRNVALVGPTGVATPGDPMTLGVSLNWRM
jgi:iron complex outermembrane recepter protein